MKKFKIFLKKVILTYFWDGDKSIFKIFLQEGYFEKHIRFLNYISFKKILAYRLFFLPLLDLIIPQEDYNEIIKAKDLFIYKRYYNLNEKEKIIFLRLMAELKLFDETLIPLCFELIDNTKETELKYWLLNSIDKIIFWNTLTFPKEYFIKRKESFNSICTSFEINKPQLQQKINTEMRKKICCITYMMEPSLKNSVQRVLMMIINNLDKELFDISVCCIDSLYSEPHSLANITWYNNSYTKRNEILKMFSFPVDIHYCVQTGIKEKLQETIDYIYSENPDLILDMSDEYSITSCLYAQDFKTLYFPLRGYVTCSYCSHMIAANVKLSMAQSDYFNNVLDGIKLINWSLPEYRMPCSVTYSRKQFDLPEENFILITTGMIPVHDSYFFSKLIKILKEDEKMIWIIVGITEMPKYLQSNAQELITNKQIINWGYENNLPALYKICNVFVNPNKTGGSGGIAIAAQQGIPLVITDYPSDALRWIHPENTVLEGYEGFEKEINKLKTDELYYKDQSKKYKSLVNVVCETEKIWKNFNNLLMDVIKE